MTSEIVEIVVESPSASESDFQTPPESFPLLPAASIFPVPPMLKHLDHYAFKPEIVSIGPYCKSMFRMQKEQFLEKFLETANKGRTVVVSVADLEASIDEERIRAYYSETLTETGEELARMMVRDGCFIIMMILLAAEQLPLLSDDHSARVRNHSALDRIFKVPYYLPTIRRDLLILPNQIPFEVLEDLFGKLGIRCAHSFRRLAATFFVPLLGTMPKIALDDLEKVDSLKHLLAIVRQIWLPPRTKTLGDVSRGQQNRDFVISATKLEAQGIRFRARDSDMRLHIEIDRNVVHIPVLSLDPFSSNFLLNGVAYEQCCMDCRDCRDCMTSYMVFMGFLMNDKEDATLIIHEKILHNRFGTDEKIAQFFKAVSRSVAFDMKECYLAPVIRGIHEYTSQIQSGYGTTFKRIYCGNIWTILSTVATLGVMIATVGSFVVAILAYKNDTYKAPPPSS